MPLTELIHMAAPQPPLILDSFGLARNRRSRHQINESPYRTPGIGKFFLEALGRALILLFVLSQPGLPSEHQFQFQDRTSMPESNYLQVTFSIVVCSA